MTASAPHLELRDINVSFDGTPVLENLSLTAKPSEFVSVLGPSGSGKSTMLSILTGGLDAESGDVFIHGEHQPKSDPSTFAFMPQRDTLFPWRKIIDNATLGLEVAGVGKKEARERANPLFAEFGIPNTQFKYPSQLSGGMRQRVALLRTVVQGKNLLLLDEPFGALDAITRGELQSWLVGMWEKHRWTVVLITHDIREALILSDRIYVLSSKPGTVALEVEVPRDGHRDHRFLQRPEIEAIEYRLYQALAPLDFST